MECFLDLYRESASHQLSCVLIINEILAGHSERGKTEEGVSATESGREEVVRYGTTHCYFDTYFNKDASWIQ